MLIKAKNLETIDGSLIALGQKNITENSFPKLKKVGGDLHLALSWCKKLPDSLEFVGGNVFLSSEPESLIKDCLKKKKRGIIKGNIFLVGGRVIRKTNESIDYSEKIQIE